MLQRDTDNPKGKHGSFKYNLEDFGLEEFWVLNRFATHRHFLQEKIEISL
jgi:hypothetical protein